MYTSVVQLYSALVLRHNASATSRVTCHNSRQITSGAMVPTYDHTSATPLTTRREVHRISEEKARLAPHVSYHRFEYPRPALVHGRITSTVGLLESSQRSHLPTDLLPFRMTDITALWNTNAFFAYLLSVRVFKLKWEPIRLAAVVLATLGATVVVYGGSSSKPDAPEAVAHRAANNRAPLAGDLLTLAGSVLYAMYQVFYKLYAALPTDPEELFDAEPAGPYTRIPTESELEEDDALEPAQGTIVPPFGLFPNMLTSFIGICTFLLLWIPIPILQFLGVAHFALPTTRAQILSIVGISLTGVTFNAGFMVSPLPTQL